MSKVTIPDTACNCGPNGQTGGQVNGPTHLWRRGIG